MGLLEKIKKDRLLALKSKNSFKATKLGNIVGLVQNEMSRPKHGSEDEETVKALNKFIKGIDETLDKAGDKLTEGQRDLLDFEKVVLQSYLPKQLNADQLENIIMGLVGEGMDNIGMIMQSLKADYAGQFDGKLASTIGKKLLDEAKAI